MGQHGSACGLWPVVARVEQASAHWAKAHDVEVRASDHPSSDHTRFAQADQREVDGGEVAKGGQRLDLRPKIPDFRDRELGVLGSDPARALTDVNQTIFILVDQRPEEHSPDDAEDGRIGTDAQRQGEDDRNRQPFDSAE